jgi:hypothetical protein
VEQGKGDNDRSDRFLDDVRGTRQREAPELWSRRVRTVSLPPLHLTIASSRRPPASASLPLPGAADARAFGCIPVARRAQIESFRPH